MSIYKTGFLYETFWSHLKQMVYFSVKDFKRQYSSQVSAVHCLDRDMDRSLKILF